ncbi:MAG: hypothetical protein JWM05_1973 [Acidimicrobiales bacterium]|nr:hypothetical protein [Acidimicrobiales bacterium]
MLVAAVVLLFVLIVSLRGIAGFYTDYLWFKSLGLAGVWRGVLGAKLELTLTFMILFFVMCWSSLTIADRIAPAFRPTGPEEDLIERYHEIIGDRAGWVRVGISTVFAVFAGSSMGSHWNEWILFNNRVSFGQKDATFHTDVGFYVFQLPFLTSLLSWLFSALVLIFIITVAAHYVNGGIRAQTALERVTPQVKAHLSVLLGILALVKTGQYWLQRYDLTFSTRGTVDGATYTDSNVQLQAIYLLLLISLFAFALFIANIWRRGWVLPALAVGLWGFVAVVAGGAVPAFVQRFRVVPAESSKEAPYIRRNISATREAFGLQDVRASQYAYDGKLTAKSLRDNAGTVRNIRLWDPQEIQDSYAKLQGIRSFYAINDVDIDRYKINGQTTQVMLSTRDLLSSGAPQSSWEARHLTYTHGYGVILSPANAKAASGQPKLLLQDVPVSSTPGAPEVKRPQVYFGENQSNYVIVNTDRKELDYQGKKQTEQTSYKGLDGIKIGSGATGFIRKAAFALRFGDVNPLISGNIKPGSKVLMKRDVLGRVEAVAPFLTFDHDPYATLIDGNIKYIVDGYTSTSRYPNAQRADTSSLSDASGLRGKRFNYVRNSVKAVVDAYDGTIDLYVVDGKDPIIRAYRKAFPSLFTDGSKAPTALREHFRYPEDLFTVQTQMWSKYHVSDPDTFYNGNDAWNVAQEPGKTNVGTSATKTTDANGNPLPVNDRFQPQYLLMRLPGEKQESFLILRPFTPASTGANKQELLTAFMVAKSDPSDYGKLETYVMPSNRLPYGPSQVANQMKSNADLSKDQLSFCQQGSQCDLNNMVVVPIDGALLYVRSLYVRGDDQGTPELRRVIVSYQSASDTSNVAVADTLQQALQKLFPGEKIPGTLEETKGTTPGNPTTPGKGTTPGTNDQQIDSLIAGVVRAFDAANAAARKGDQVEYARQIQRAGTLSKQLDAALKKRGTPSSSSGTRPATTTPSTTTTIPSSGGGPATTTTSTTTTTTTVPAGF